MAFLNPGAPPPVYPPAPKVAPVGEPPLPYITSAVPETKFEVDVQEVPLYTSLAVGAAGGPKYPPKTRPAV